VKPQNSSPTPMNKALCFKSNNTKSAYFTVFDKGTKWQWGTRGFSMLDIDRFDG